MLKILSFIFFFLTIFSPSFSQDLIFKKLAELDEPWGFSFINDKGIDCY